MPVWRRIGRWLDDRLGWSSSILPVIQHPVPKKCNWFYVLGSATLVAFIVQVVTGVALAFTYVPAPNSAYETLVFITHDAMFGNVVRGIHYWGASAMVVLIFAHLSRVFLTGSFKFPREANWLVGVGLLLLTLGMAFTGQLLRWDQNAYWAIVVGAQQAGRTPFIGTQLAHLLTAGHTVGGATLTRFYATHVFLLPALIMLLIGVHLYLVVKHGISEPPEAGVVVDPKTYKQRYADLIRREGVPFWPDVAWRDVTFALAVGVLVVILALVLGPAKLIGKADPTIVQANPRPDWYFIWYFALFALLPPRIENIVIIGFPLVVFIILILLPFLFNKGERSPARRPWSIGIVLIASLSVAVLAWQGYLAPWSPNFTPKPLPVAVVAPLSEPARTGATLFEQKGCQNCHTIAGTGGHRGPNLTTIGDELSANELTWRILNGGTNMPAFGQILSPQEVEALVAFLQTRTGTTAAGP